MKVNMSDVRAQLQAARTMTYPPEECPIGWGITTTRHDSEAAEGFDQRVSNAMHFALGILWCQNDFAEKHLLIKHVHDHKGKLFVAVDDRTDGITMSHILEAFAAAWEDVGVELADDVAVVFVGGDDWRAVWSSKRF